MVQLQAGSAARGHPDATPLFRRSAHDPVQLELARGAASASNAYNTAYWNFVIPFNYSNNPLNSYMVSQPSTEFAQIYNPIPGKVRS